MQSVSLSQRRTTGILPQTRYEKNKVELNLRRWERDCRALWEDGSLTVQVNRLESKSYLVTCYEEPLTQRPSSSIYARGTSTLYPFVHPSFG